MIQFIDIVKTYGNHVVLDHVNLEISGGEFVTVVGPSGAGKSTLMHSLIGDCRIDSGSVMVDGYDVTAFSPDALQEYRQKVGMVFQNYRLLERKTVYENVAFALEVCGWKDEDIRERVYEMLDVVDMLDHEKKFPAQLSGGEGQRTAIARALAHEPRLFVADEPTGNLDYWNMLGILELLTRINDSGVTVLMSTHNRQLVDLLERRVVVLSDGKIVSDKEKSHYEVDMLLGNLPAHVEVDEVEDLFTGEQVGEIEITEIG